jgi:predicted house-cleaning noncanonical NTP pyrophosphatase (MazG superfamily)
MDEKISESSLEMREMIEKAIEDHIITRDEYDKIIHIATKDGYLDRHEQALLRELQQMIEDKVVKFVMK